MRRIVSIALLAVFSWQFAAPAFSPDAEANLPLCCRRHGKHHCMMSRMARQESGQLAFTTVTERCPYGPASVTAAHTSAYQPRADSSFHTGSGNQSVVAPPTAPVARNTFLRGRHKRGPPSLLA